MDSYDALRSIGRRLYRNGAGAVRSQPRVRLKLSIATWARLTPWDKAALVVAIFFVCGGYYLLLGLKVYGLDSVQYYANVTFKLREEGRWIDYLLHGTLRDIPLPVGAALYVVLGWLLSFKILRRLSDDFSVCAVAASVIIISVPFAQQSLWPVLLLPTLLIMLLIEWLSRTNLSHRVVYLVGGILIFGCLQNYYFLLPLFFIGKLERERLSAKLATWRLLDHLLSWIAGSVVGVIAVFLAVYLIIGQIGIEPAAWRRSMPIHNVRDVWRNVDYVSVMFLSQIRWLVYLMTRWNTALLALIAAFALMRLTWWRGELKRLIVLIFVAFSFFAFSIPLAPVIQTRSLVALDVALIALLFVPRRNDLPLVKWFSIALLLWAGFNLMDFSHGFLNRYKSKTSYVANRIGYILPHNPTSYKAIATLGTADTNFPDAKILNRPPMMRAIVLSTGAKAYWDCQISRSAECKSIKDEFSSVQKDNQNGIRYLGTMDGVAVVSVGH